MDDKKQVQIGPREVILVRPAWQECYAIAYLRNGGNPFLLGGAALGLCWQQPRPPKTRLHHHRGDILAYGRAVWTELREAGWPMPDLIRASTTALELCDQGLVSEEEVAAEAATFREE